ncbi:MAG: FkbM family methyltransferase [Terriglobales bacterium]
MTITHPPAAGEIPEPDSGLIIDVGMHEGQDTRFYLDKGFRVVAVEAEPGLVEAARRKFAPELAAGRLEIVHGAISDRTGPIPFWVFPEKSEWNTLDPQHATRNIALGCAHRVVQVQGRGFDGILSRYGVPHYLKIDIEGADLLCVQALSGARSRPDFVSLELAMASAETAFCILAELYRLGYRRFKAVDQALNPSRKIMAAGGGRFVMGSSGSFGEETPGAWEDAFEIARHVGRLLRRERMLGPGGRLARVAWMVNGAARLPAQIRTLRQWRAALTTGSWFDLHAALPQGTASGSAAAGAGSGRPGATRNWRRAQ